MRTRSVVVATVSVVALSVAGPAVAVKYSAYKTPAGGKWVVQDMFDSTAGGSAEIARGGGSLTRLSLNVGERERGASRCGTTKRLAIVKGLPIKRLGSYRRPAVGRLGKNKLITTISTTVKVDGVRKQGKIKVLFEKDGRSASTAELSAGSCVLPFLLRKKK